jgi:hypothetical protein
MRPSLSGCWRPSPVPSERTEWRRGLAWCNHGCRRTVGQTPDLLVVANASYVSLLKLTQ